MHAPVLSYYSDCCNTVTTVAHCETREDSNVVNESSAILTMSANQHDSLADDTTSRAVHTQQSTVTPASFRPLPKAPPRKQKDGLAKKKVLPKCLRERL